MEWRRGGAWVVLRNGEGSWEEGQAGRTEEGRPGGGAGFRAKRDGHRAPRGRGVALLARNPYIYIQQALLKGRTGVCGGVGFMDPGAKLQRAKRGTSYRNKGGGSVVGQPSLRSSELRGVGVVHRRPDGSSVGASRGAKHQARGLRFGPQGWRTPGPGRSRPGS
jgi:hypothetical protein